MVILPLQDSDPDKYREYMKEYMRDRRREGVNDVMKSNKKKNNSGKGKQKKSIKPNTNIDPHDYKTVKGLLNAVVLELENLQSDPDIDKVVRARTVSTLARTCKELIEVGELEERIEDIEEAIQQQGRVAV